MVEVNGETEYAFCIGGTVLRVSKRGVGGVVGVHTQ